MQNAELEGATQIIETQATVIIPSNAAVSTQDHQRAIETQIDADRGMDTLELRQMLDAEQDVVMEDSQMAGKRTSVLVVYKNLHARFEGTLSTLTQEPEDLSQTPRPRNATTQEATAEEEVAEQLPSPPIPPAIDPAIVNGKKVECDCNIEVSTRI